MIHPRKVEFRFRPLVSWPGGKLSECRWSSPFKMEWSTATTKLRKELGLLDAAQADVYLALPDHPGVVLSFTGKYGSMQVYTDELVSWQANLRALADHLEHLRLATIYGVGKKGEHYRGWKALPGGSTPAGGSMTPGEAAGVLAEYGGFSRVQIVENLGIAQKAFRMGCRLTHPDRGGDAKAFQRLTEAAAIIARDFGRESL